jgi:molecular chaperone DnaK
MAEAKTALAGDNPDDIAAKTQSLAMLAMKMGEEIYKTDQSPDGGSDAAQADAAARAADAKDDDVVDADFTEVDDKK